MEVRHYVDLSKLPKDISKEKLVLCEIVKESLEQLDNDSIVVPRNTTARLVTIQQHRQTLHSIRRSPVPPRSAKSPELDAFNHSVRKSPLASRLKGKFSRGLSKDQESTLEMKAKISAPVPHISSELLQGPLSLGPKVVKTKTAGGTERISSLVEYETHVPKLVVHTHSHNPATRIEKEVRLSSDRVAQLVSEIVSGTSYPDAFKDISTWQRELCCVWTANGKSVICALSDWSFEKNEDQWMAVPDSGTVGTCWRRVGGERSKNGHLMNCYSSHVSGKHTMLRDVRLHQWIACIKSLLDTRQRMGLPLDAATGMARVCSLSLVATSLLAWDEKAMVQQQNALMKTVAELGLDSIGHVLNIPRELSRMQDALGIDLVHINYQTNVYEIAGIELGERFAKKLNAKGLLRYCRWLLTDVSQVMMTSLPSNGRPTTLQALIAHVLSHVDRETSKVQIDTDLLGKMVQLTQELAKTAENMSRLAAATGGHTAIADLYCAAKALLVLLRSHLGHGAPVSRVCEHLALAIMDCALNVVACVNCKSGCDRTGLVYALRAAVAMVWETRPDERTELTAAAVQFDSLSAEHQAVYEKGLSAWTVFISEHTRRASMAASPGSPAYVKWEERLSARHHLLLSELRNCFFANMMDVCWKVVLYSTGLPGFKFGQKDSLLKNPHVLSLMPPFIQSPSGIHLNRDFREFFIGASAYRGGVGEERANGREASGSVGSNLNNIAFQL